MEIKKEKGVNDDLVWAQMRYCPYWPAKVVQTPPMLGSTPPNKICVLFFGTKQFGFVAIDKIQNYSKNREKYVKKGRGVDFRKSVQHMDEYISDKVKFYSHASVIPAKNKIVVKTEHDIAKQLGIKIEKLNEGPSNVSEADVGATADSTVPPISWSQEKQDLIEKIISLKTENQNITQNLNEKRIELVNMNKSLKKTEQCFEEYKTKSASNDSKLRLELSQAHSNVEIHQKDIAALKRENQLLVSQNNQLKTALVQKEDEKTKDRNNDAEADNVCEVENILDDKLVTERYYFVRWKGFDASNDSWERESNLCCAKVLKKYKTSKLNHSLD